MTLGLDIYVLGLVVIFGTAYFYIIWDCARKNFKEVVKIAINNDALLLRALQLISRWAYERGFETAELQEIIEQYEKNSEKIKKHKL